MAIRSNDRVLVTGAAAGFGLALTQLLSQRGCRVLAVDLAGDTPSSLGALPGVSYRRLDVRSDDDWQAAKDLVLSEWQGLDLLFNNAGIGSGGDLEDESIERWEHVISINLLGVVRGCQTFVPVFKQQHSGHIVNTASAAGLVYPPGMASYCSVKAGVVALSETLMFELEPFGIQVSAICPSFFQTSIADNMPEGDAKRMAAAMLKASGRTAREVAERTLAGVDTGDLLILPDRDVRAAYLAKRFAHPLYLRQVRSMAAKARARRDQLRSAVR
jgi:NAD(P)-dependent dehydrogenase (short-subunit alcohol dehydrogenase family)